MDTPDNSTCLTNKIEENSIFDLSRVYVNFIVIMTGVSGAVGHTTKYKIGENVELDEQKWVFHLRVLPPHLFVVILS